MFWGKQNAFFTQEILFNDRKGISKNGIWSAPIMTGARERVNEWRLVQNRARQGAVAIPNSCFIGDENTHSRKYSVTTTTGGNGEWPTGIVSCFASTAPCADAKKTKQNVPGMNQQHGLLSGTDNRPRSHEPTRIKTHRN